MNLEQFLVEAEKFWAKQSEQERAFLRETVFYQDALAKHRKGEMPKPVEPCRPGNTFGE